MSEKPWLGFERQWGWLSTRSIRKWIAGIYFHPSGINSPFILLRTRIHAFPCESSANSEDSSKISDESLKITRNSPRMGYKKGGLCAWSLKIVVGHLPYYCAVFNRLRGNIIFDPIVRLRV